MSNAHGCWFALLTLPALIPSEFPLMVGSDMMMSAAIGRNVHLSGLLVGPTPPNTLSAGLRYQVHWKSVILSTDGQDSWRLPHLCRRFSNG